MRRIHHRPAVSRDNQRTVAHKTVLQYPNDPRIFLYVMGEWYCYNPYDPPIGSGAMGTVFLGNCCSDGRPVAVKRVIDSYANNPQVRERAKLEASLAFRHPNLIEMLGYCEYAPNSGPIFLVSNYVQGQNIDKYVMSLVNSIDRIQKISLAICSVLDALSFVHAHNMVHRDVKPSNIMIENNSNVRLMDLGIAKANEGNAYSQFGFIGTPEYSAPEQIRGERDCINKTTDLYELGITFYELLAGVNPMACASETETLTKQIAESLPPNDKIPQKLMKVLCKATEKEQSKRYQTAEEFKNGIMDALLPEPSVWSRMSSWINRHIFIFMSAIILMGILSMAVLFILSKEWN